MLTTSGDVYSWGDNKYGQLGINNKNKQCLPQKINLENITAIFCGTYTSFAISKSNEIYAWGLNNCGQLGLGHDQEQNCPHKLDFDFGTYLKTIYGGYNHTFAITKSSKIYSWGNNKFGQLGISDKENQYLPRRVEF